MQRQTILLDDDPTGTQTVAGVAVLTEWSVEALAAELRRGAAGFFVLTNSRALPTEAAFTLYQDIGENLKRASAQTSVPVRVLARGDSTLRGHFPAETDALDTTLGPFDLTLLVPYFEEGERRTFDDIHYVGTTPAAETPFAQDAVFGYRSSNLRAWVAEKTGGRVDAAAVASLSRATLDAGVDATVAALRAVPTPSYCVVNASQPAHVATLAAAVDVLEQGGVRVLARTAASFGAACLGQASAPQVALPPRAPGGNGGLIVVGSHVPKTTEQLAFLQERGTFEAWEITSPPAPRVPSGCGRSSGTLWVTGKGGSERSSPLFPNDEGVPAPIGYPGRGWGRERLDAALREGRDVLIYTSRTVTHGDLETSARYSAALVALVQGLTVRPRWILAKGGITSSDLATKALGVRRAEVVGPLLPGVPLWRLGDESRWPGLLYTVFPGNVGGPEALHTAWKCLP